MDNPTHIDMTLWILAGLYVLQEKIEKGGFVGQRAFNMLSEADEMPTSDGLQELIDQVNDSGVKFQDALSIIESTDNSQDTFTQETFKIIVLSRADLLNTGLTNEQIDRIPDSVMKEIARKMADYYMDNLYQLILRTITKDILKQHKLDLDAQPRSVAE